MLNSKMKRSMAWIMSVAVVMTAAPVSAADFTDVADVETTAEQETCSNKKAGADTGRTLAEKISKMPESIPGLSESASGMESAVCTKSVDGRMA